jgi:hypothetical protein
MSHQSQRRSHARAALLGISLEVYRESPEQVVVALGRPICATEETCVPPIDCLTHLHDPDACLEPFSWIQHGCPTPHRRSTPEVITGPRRDNRSSP